MREGSPPSVPQSGGSSGRPTPPPQDRPSWKPSIEWKLNATVELAKAILANPNTQTDVAYNIDDAIAQAVTATAQIVKAWTE